MKINECISKARNELRGGAGAFAALLLILCGTGCGKDEVIGRPTDVQGKEGWTMQEQLEEIQGISGAEPIPVIKITTSTIREELSVTGELIPEESAMVKPLMDGRINFLRQLKVGDLVEEGELLAKIDDRDIEDEIAYQEKQIEISTEKLALDIERLEQQTQKTEFDRQMLLEGLKTQTAYDESELNLKISKNSLDRSRIELEQEQNKLLKKLREREKVPITAPIGGMVVSANHLKGSQNNSAFLAEDIMEIDGKQVGSSTELFGIISQKGFLARCLVNGKDKARIREGQPVITTVQSHQALTIDGEVAKVALLQDPQNHAYKVWVRLHEIDPSFTSGLFVRCEIELERHDGALVIEKKYLKERSGESFVQLVKDGKVTNVIVETGLKQGALIELLSGVEVGDLLIAREVVLEPDQLVTPEEIEPELDEGRS